MLYVIEVNDRFEVQQMIPCDGGIDQALERIANELTHPEEDYAATLDVVVEKWNDVVKDEWGIGDPHSRFCVSRGRRHFSLGRDHK